MCSFPDDTYTNYLSTTPSWIRNGHSFSPDAITHTIINHNGTLHILRIKLIREDFLSKTIEYGCFLIKKGGELDESDIKIIPQGHFSVYEYTECSICSWIIVLKMYWNSDVHYCVHLVLVSLLKFISLILTLM